MGSIIHEWQLACGIETWLASGQTEGHTRGFAFKIFWCINDKTLTLTSITLTSTMTIHSVLFWCSLKPF